MTLVADSVVDILQRVRVNDADTHIGEPDDLWTSRVSKKWGDAVPHVVENPETGESDWYTGDTLICVRNRALYAEDFDELTHAAASEPITRLAWMDAQGVSSQVLFPNILGFDMAAFISMEPELSLECIRAYNDFQTEFCSADPKRLIPLVNLPWWNMDASVKELERCHDLGHRGVNLGWEFEKIGFPPLRSDYWEPILKLTEEMGLPLNFHVGFNSTQLKDTGFHSLPDLEALAYSSLHFVGNMRCIVELIMGRICDHYPTLKFVSVESGAGFLPYLLDMLDWQFNNRNTFEKYPDMLLPSEYFKRQIYATFWFERGIGRIIDQFPNNLMFSSDFPHPTSLTPGEHLPYVRGPRDTIIANLADVPEKYLVPLLQDNAAKVFNIDMTD
jgi:predicted TIM-barrel fold metal-dependent hydrolase